MMRKWTKPIQQARARKTFESATDSACLACSARQGMRKTTLDHDLNLLEDSRMLAEYEPFTFNVTWDGGNTSTDSPSPTSERVPLPTKCCDNWSTTRLMQIAMHTQGYHCFGHGFAWKEGIPFRMLGFWRFKHPFHATTLNKLNLFTSRGCNLPVWCPSILLFVHFPIKRFETNLGKNNGRQWTRLAVCLNRTLSHDKLLLPRNYHRTYPRGFTEQYWTKMVCQVDRYGLAQSSAPSPYSSCNHGSRKTTSRQSIMLPSIDLLRWLTIHKGYIDIPRIYMVVNWITQAFEWFRQSVAFWRSLAMQANVNASRCSNSRRLDRPMHPSVVDISMIGGRT